MGNQECQVNESLVPIFQLSQQRVSSKSTNGATAIIGYPDKSQNQAYIRAGSKQSNKTLPYTSTVQVFVCMCLGGKQIRCTGMNM